MGYKYKYHHCPERLWAPPCLLSNVYKGLFFVGVSGWVVKLTTHLHLVPRSYTSSPQYVFMVWYLVKHRRFIIVLTRVPTPIMEPEGSCRIHKSAPIPWPCVTFRNKLFS